MRLFLRHDLSTHGVVDDLYMTYLLETPILGVCSCSEVTMLEILTDMDYSFHDAWGHSRMASNLLSQLIHLGSPYAQSLAPSDNVAVCDAATVVRFLVAHGANVMGAVTELPKFLSRRMREATYLWQAVAEKQADIVAALLTVRRQEQLQCHW